MATKPIIVQLSGEPQGKGRPRFVRATGIAFTPARTRSYESALRYAAQEAMGSRQPVEGPLQVRVLAAFPIPASWSAKKRAAATAGEVMPLVKPDVDNIIKVFDALNEVVWRDDKQVVECSVRKIYSDRPRLVIEVESFGATRQDAA